MTIQPNQQRLYKLLTEPEQPLTGMWGFIVEQNIHRADLDQAKLDLLFDSLHSQTLDNQAIMENMLGCEVVKEIKQLYQS